MIGSLLRRIAPLALALLASHVLALVPLALAQEPADARSGQFFTIEEPLDSDALERIKTATKQVITRAAAQKGDRPILVFEIKPGKAQPGSSGYGISHDLADFLSTGLGGALTVAYVPESLKGYAVIPVLACDDIVMGSSATLGPITPEGEPVRAGYREPLRDLARRKGRNPSLYVGLLDRDADLRLVRTGGGQIQYVLADELPAFEKANQVAPGDIQPAWEGGQRGILSAKRARDEGFSKLTADDRGVIANVYHIAARGVANDPTLLEEARPVWIQVEGRLDNIKESYLRRRVEQARREGVNLVFFQINSKGGLSTAADNIAALIAGIKDMKTVAYIDDQAVGVAALIPLACDDIVFRRGARMGDVHELITGNNGQVQELTEAQASALAKRAEGIAAQKGHSTAIAVAMIDPGARVFRATDAGSATPRLVLESTLRANPNQFLDPTMVKEAGEPLLVRSTDAASFNLGQEVGDIEEFKALYGLRGKPIRIDGPTWVDGLVTTLNDPFVSWVLLFIGVFMLILEIKMPGVGLPAITSALAFLLFFWSRYLSGTADQLEILLFLVGLICVGLELFVFPGFGVFGLSGFLLILVSIVMASHTFVWPTQEYEYRQMAGTLFQVVGVMVGVGVGATLFGRFLPSLPVINRMVLKAEPYEAEENPDPTAKPAAIEGYESFAFLMGETGRTTTVLKPTGKARFGSLLIDVRADGYYIERDTLIEVVDVQGLKVIVKPVA
jgi:membrane-bound serine protease (ClpP class)